jgi:hypothetical protein
MRLWLVHDVKRQIAHRAVAERLSATAAVRLRPDSARLLPTAIATPALTWPLPRRDRGLVPPRPMFVVAISGGHVSAGVVRPNRRLLHLKVPGHVLGSPLINHETKLYSERCKVDTLQRTL